MNESINYWKNEMIFKDIFIDEKPNFLYVY